MKGNDFIKFIPVAIEKPWGGSKIANYSSDMQNTTKPIGELILCSTLEQYGQKMQVMEGQKIKQVIPFQKYWERSLSNLLGLSWNFPFMLKILNTHGPLSIQVHPSTKDVQRLFQIDNIGKYENWTILEAEENARVYLGLKEYSQNNIEHFFTAVQNKSIPTTTILNFLNCYRPAVQDIYEIMPGTIHGTTGEILFFEAQQMSDYTFRIYDFHNNRDLHIEHAKKVLKDNPIITKKHGDKISSQYFSLHSYNVGKKSEFAISDIFAVVTYIGENAILQYDGSSYPIHWGDTFLFFRDSVFYILPEEHQSEKEQSATMQNSVFIVSPTSTRPHPPKISP